ncbi:9337_t:CDS:2 [Funneliformis mosseae]|uniref:9337_t:CDS:1 n=1 Tax=Funneliformis mosseae TaxID=27381 RepID=A0A9N9C7L8_FUNMO|nr:9337_t:CDS:2 [Funneliformis mosseae]
MQDFLCFLNSYQQQVDKMIADLQSKKQIITALAGIAASYLPMHECL